MTAPTLDARVQEILAIHHQRTSGPYDSLVGREQARSASLERMIRDLLLRLDRRTQDLNQAIYTHDKVLAARDKAEVQLVSLRAENKCLKQSLETALSAEDQLRSLMFKPKESL